VIDRLRWATHNLITSGSIIFVFRAVLEIPAHEETRSTAAGLTAQRRPVQSPPRRSGDCLFLPKISATSRRRTRAPRTAQHSAWRCCIRFGVRLAHSLPHTFTPEKVVYTGTMTTTLSWVVGTPARREDERNHARSYLGLVRRDELGNDPIAVNSVPACVWFRCRMSSLGQRGTHECAEQAEGNWRWRFRAECCAELAGNSRSSRRLRIGFLRHVSG